MGRNVAPAVAIPGELTAPALTALLDDPADRRREAFVLAPVEDHVPHGAHALATLGPRLEVHREREALRLLRVDLDEACPGRRGGGEPAERQQAEERPPNHIAHRRRPSPGPFSGPVACTTTPRG